MSKKSFIDSVRVASPCSEDWEKMEGNERVRFCSHCSKHVNNLSDMTRKEAMRLVRASGGNLCIRIIADTRTKRPIFADQLMQITRRAPGLAAGVMTASVSLSMAAYAQDSPAARPTSESVAISSVDEKKAETSASNSSGKTLTGTITDPNGAVIFGATVTIFGISAGLNATTSSNGEGEYRFDDLMPGTYRIETSAPGFAMRATEVVVGDQGKAVSDSSLEVGGIEVAVQVESNVEMEVSVMGGAVSVVEYSSPLARAVADEDVDAVLDLLQKGADVNGKEDSYSKITPLFLAVEHGNVEIARLLLDNGAKVNARDGSKQTPLMRVDDDATVELIGLLVSYRVKVNLVDEEGNTALILAARSVNSDVLKALMDAGADINLSNNDGQTALMNAASNGDIESVRLLLNFGSRVNDRNSDGESAWDLASDDEVKDLLASFGAETKLKPLDLPAETTEESVQNPDN
jgi:hypothetical protein